MIVSPSQNTRHITVLEVTGARIGDPLLSKVLKLRFDDPRSIAHVSSFTRFTFVRSNAKSGEASRKTMHQMGCTRSALRMANIPRPKHGMAVGLHSLLVKER